MQWFNMLGIDAGYVIIGICCVLVILIILYIVLWSKFKEFRTNYEIFMQGKDGKDLETAILDKFKQIDKISDQVDINASEILTIFEKLKFTYQKFSIVKYDAFKEMGGKLSFSLCMLTDNNDGFVLTSVHSSNEGCYIYIKEIIKGESYVLLSEEEKKVLTEAKTRRSCLDDK